MTKVKYLDATEQSYHHFSMQDDFIIFRKYPTKYNHCVLLDVGKPRALRAWIEVFQPSNCAQNSNYSKIFHLNIDSQV
jgi:hypothetical protein